MGADLAAGYAVIRYLQSHGIKHSLVFKDLQAQFLKRPESHVEFLCEYQDRLQGLKNQLVSAGGRQETKLPVVAYCPKLSSQEPVAKFTLTVSVKKFPA